MAIVASVIDDEVVQRDGRISVVETHTDQLGRVYRLVELAAGGSDLNALLVAHAAQLAQQLHDNEIAANIAEIEAYGSLAVTRTDYSTNAENAAALRAAYRDATMLQAIMIVDPKIYLS